MTSLYVVPGSQFMRSRPIHVTYFLDEFALRAYIAACSKNLNFMRNDFVSYSFGSRSKLVLCYNLNPRHAAYMCYWVKARNQLLCCSPVLSDGSYLITPINTCVKIITGVLLDDQERSSIISAISRNLLFDQGRIQEFWMGCQGIGLLCGNRRGRVGGNTSSVIGIRGCAPEIKILPDARIFGLSDN